MSKAMLVIDMPENGYECKLLVTNGTTERDYCIVKSKYVGSLAEYARPDECPLNVLPKTHKGRSQT